MGVRAASSNLLTVGQSSAQVSDGSLKFQGPLKTYLSRTFSSGNRRTYTISFWAKSCDHDEHGSVGTGGGQVFTAGTVGAGARATFGFSGPTNGANKDAFQLGHNASGSSWASLNSVSKFRDFSAWQHFVVKVDVTQTLASDRVKFYVNNVEQSLTGTYPSDEDQPVNNTVGHAIGRYNPEGTDYFDGLLSNFYFIDGQALGPSYFGYTDPLTNTWRPKKCLDGDQGAPNTELLYNVDTSDNRFDSSDTVKEYATAGLTFSTYTTPQTANPGGLGANSAHVYKSPTGSAITWLVSTDTTDRYIWISFDGKTWSSKGSTYDTDGSTQSVYAVYIALAGGSNASNVTVTSATVTFGTNGFYLPLDGNLPIGRDQSGKGNDWEPVSFGGSAPLDKATGALPILNTVGGGKVATVGVRTDAFWDSCVLALPLIGGSGTDYSNEINSGSTTKSVTVTSATSSTTLHEFYASSMNFDGSNDKLDVADSTDFDVSTGDWCAECWFYTPASDGTSQRIFANYAGDAAQFNLGINSLQLFAYLGSTQVIFASATTAIHAAEWVHLALTHVDSSNTTTLYINGVSKATATTALSGSVDGFYLGHSTAHGTRWITANYQDVRFYKGTAKYTGNFIPAATNPDIFPDTPSGVSLSSELTKVIDGSVAFDGNGDYLSFVSSTDFAFGTGAYTLEFWVNSGRPSGENGLFGTFTSSDYGIGIWHNGASLYFEERKDSYDATNPRITYTTFDWGNWNHVAMSRDSTSGTLRAFVNGVQVGTVTSNLRDIAATSETTIGENGAAGNKALAHISNLRVLKGTALYTANFTPPTAPLTDITNTKLLCCQLPISAGVAAASPNISGVNNGTVWSSGGGSNFESSNPIQDAFNGDADDYTRTDNASVTATWTAPESIAWSSTLKIRGARDSGTDADIIVNGVDVTSQFTASSATLETITITGVSSPLTSIALVGVAGASQPRFSAVYIDDVMLVDPVGAYGDPVATTFNPFTTDINTVIGRPSSFVTFNPLDTSLGTTQLKNGNLDMISNGSWSTSHARGTCALTKGKWYWECTAMNTPSHAQFGFSTRTANLQETYSGGQSQNWTFYWNNGREVIDPAASSAEYFGTGTMSLSTGDTMSVALDMDNGTWQFFRLGIPGAIKTLADTDDGSTSSITELYPFSGVHSMNLSHNFGQKPFKYPPPEGFQAVCLAGMDNPAFVRPDSVVGVATYAGNGSAVSVTGYNFSPDLIWIKGYTDGDRHGVYDTVRGVQERLQASEQVAEDTVNGVMSFNSNGFSVGDYADSNGSGRGYVAWCWKAGGSKNTFNVDDVGYASAADAGLDGGTVTPSGATVGTKQGFSIIKWSRASGTDTISHGLSEAPTFIIQKSIDNDHTWQVGGPFIGSGWDRRMYLDTDADEADSTSFGWTGNFGPTSTVIRTGGTGYVDGDMIAYCWHDVPGLQKFGKYTGNNSTNGPYVELGFEPAIIIFKNQDSDANWMIYDNVRDKSNESYKCLYPNLQNDENDTTTDNEIDILSTGFKLRNDDGQSNDAETYMYAAWAYQPINNLYGAQSNAR